MLIYLKMLIQTYQPNYVTLSVTKRIGLHKRGKGVAKELNRKKIATFLWLVDRQAREIYNTLFPNNGRVNGILGQATVVVPAGDENAETNENAAIAVANRRT